MHSFIHSFIPPFAYYRKVSSQMVTVLIAAPPLPAESTFCVFSCKHTGSADGVFLFVPSVLALWCESSSARSIRCQQFVIQTCSCGNRFSPSPVCVCMESEGMRRFNLLTAVENFHCQDIALWFGNHRRVGCYALFAVAEWIVNQPHLFTPRQRPLYCQLAYNESMRVYDSVATWSIVN